MERVRREYSPWAGRPKSASLVPSDWCPPLPANQASELVSLMGVDTAQNDPLLPALRPRSRVRPASAMSASRAPSTPVKALSCTARPQSARPAAMAKALSPTKTASRLSPTKPTQAQAQAAPDGSGAPQPSDVVQLASSMMDRIMRGGGLPARSGSARQAGAPARPSFGTTNKPVRPHTAHTTGRMSAIRITGEDGRPMLVLESATDDVVDDSPAEHLLRQLREQGRRPPSPPKMSKEKWVKNKEAALKAAASGESRGIQHLGPARRAVEDKLDMLRGNPQLLEALQKRIAGSQGDAALRAKQLMAHNTAQLYDTVPERRKAMYKQMADERLKRTKEYAARKAAAEQAREEEMRVLLGKHDKLKAERAAQAAADEATRARQHVEGRTAACASLAAKLRFLKRAVVVARYRRKLDVMRAISARRVQKAWRRKLGWIRARRAEGVALMLAMRWKRKLVLKKEHLRLGAAHVVEFITQLQSQQAVVTKFKEFYKNVRLVQGHFKRGILMRQGQARMIAHQWTLAEQQALHERDSKATGEDSEPLLQKKEKGGDKKIKKVKSLAKDPVLLPPGEEDGAVPLEMKRLVTMRFIRIKRRGLAQVREKYRVAYENYLVQVAHWEQMLAARHISNKHGDDHDVPKPEPPPKPPVLMLATPKELKAVMQCGVAMVMNQKEEDVLVRSLSLPHDWVPLEAESNLLARGVEESIERRTKGSKKTKSSKDDTKVTTEALDSKPSADGATAPPAAAAAKPKAALVRTKSKKK